MTFVVRALCNVIDDRRVFSRQPLSGYFALTVGARTVFGWSNSGSTGWPQTPRSSTTIIARTSWRQKSTTTTTTWKTTKTNRCRRKRANLKIKCGGSSTTPLDTCCKSFAHYYSSVRSIFIISYIIAIIGSKRFFIYI